MDKRIVVMVVLILGAGILYKGSLESMGGSSNSSSSLARLWSAIWSLSSAAQPLPSASYTVPSDLVSMNVDASLGTMTIKSTVDGKEINVSRGLLVNIPYFKDMEEIPPVKEKEKEKDREKADNGIILLPFPIESIKYLMDILDASRSGYSSLNDRLQVEFQPAYGGIPFSDIPDFANVSEFLGIDRITDEVMTVYIWKFFEKNPNATVQDIENSVKNIQLKLVISKIAPLIITLLHLPSGVNFYDYVIETYVKPGGNCDMQLLISLAHLACTGPFMSAESIDRNRFAHALIRLYIFQLLKRDPNLATAPLSLDDVIASINLSSLIPIIRGEYPVVVSSAGFMALTVVIPPMPSLWARLTGHIPLASLFAGMLDLQSKNIKDLYGLSLVKGNEKILSIHLENNLLTIIPAAALRVFTQLKELILRNNQLSQISPQAFGSLGNLTFLILQGNTLTFLHNNIFASLVYLTFLDLSSNQLTQIPADLFLNQSHLKQLWVNNNLLTQISAGAFRNLESLRDLNLSNNQLTQLPVGLFRALGNLEILNLRNNPLSATMTVDQVKAMLPHGDSVRILL